MRFFRPFSRVLVTPFERLDVNDPAAPPFIRDLCRLDCNGYRVICIVVDSDGEQHARIAHVWQGGDKQWNVTCCYDNAVRFLRPGENHSAPYRVKMKMARDWVQGKIQTDPYDKRVAALDTYR